MVRPHKGNEMKQRKGTLIKTEDILRIVRAVKIPLIVTGAISVLFIGIMLTFSGCNRTKTAKVVPILEPIGEDASAREGSQFITPVPQSEPEDEGEDDAAESEQGPVLDLTRVRAFDQAKTIYAVSNVNIRKGPSTEFEPLGMLKLGEAVEAIGQDEDGWYEFMYHNEVAFACDDYLSDEKPVFEEESEDSEQADAGTQVLVPEDDDLIPDIEAEHEQEVAEVTDPSDVLIIGDSRCVMMKSATGGGGCSWICQKSKGYKWLESTAIPEADEMIGSGTKVVINLGVNDVGNVNRYAALVNSKAAEWAERGAVTYYVSVNPVSDNARVSEAQVEFFNNQIQSQLSGIRWIDTHGYLMSDGFNATDGIHYDNATSVKIFQAIMGSL